MSKPSLTISELFYSIQGESTRAGLPCAFIRLSGCNLRCLYCDSSYTWEEPGNRMSVAEIMTWLAGYPDVIVQVTGGEPLLQDSVYPLLDDLAISGRVVLLETNGSIAVDRVPDSVHIILDLKCPDSGVSYAVNWVNIDILRKRRERGCRDELKFVLSSEEDYAWARQQIARRHLAGIAPLLFSPVSDTLPTVRLAELMLADRIQARLQPQLHKIIWPEMDRGV